MTIIGGTLTIKRFWAWPWELKKCGILGMNARNLFIAKHNHRCFYPRVDDKILNKELCQKHGVPTPETYAIIEYLGDAKKISQIAADRPEFVIKPARGSGGRGVTVIARHTEIEFETSSGNILMLNDLRYRISAILGGAYSLGGHPDRVIVEKRVNPHIVFANLAIGGTPDIRIILYNNQTLMCMLRLPTSVSGGRANLHQGAVGVGIDIATGCTHGGVYRGRAITIHPETNASLQNIQVPHWQEILAIATKLSAAIEMSYVGVDIVLDNQFGPLVLEANARPGLAIQIANAKGLRSVLEKAADSENLS